MIRCLRVRRGLALLAGGELRPRRALAVERHLARCEACRREAEGLLAAREALGRAGTAPRLSDPESFDDEVLRRVRSGRGGNRVQDFLVARAAWPLGARARALSAFAAGLAVSVAIAPWVLPGRRAATGASARADARVAALQREVEVYRELQDRIRAGGVRDILVAPSVPVHRATLGAGEYEEGLRSLEAERDRALQALLEALRASRAPLPPPGAGE